MTAPSATEQYLVPGLVRGIEILRLFRNSRQEITAPDIARELAIPRSTVFRLAQTLEHLRLIEKTGSGNAYRLAAGVLAIGYQYLASLDIAEIAKPHLNALRDQTGFSAHLVVRDGTSVVVVQKAAGYSHFSSSLTIGTRLPAHGTVLGRMILAFLPDEQLTALYEDQELESYSEQTPTNVGQLKDILHADRRRGHAISESYFESGIASVAAPVLGIDGRADAAINVTLQPGFTIEEPLIDAIVDTANAISASRSHRIAAE